MNNINTLENGILFASRFFWSPTLIYMRDIFSFKFIEITVSTMSEQQLKKSLLKNRRERRENKARGGEKPECTRGYMRILSRRATPLSQAQ